MKDENDHSTEKRTRRFIAGAVCPECREVDRLVVERIAVTQRRICVACGFSDEVDGTGSAGVPRGKHDQPRRMVMQESVVRIVEVGAAPVDEAPRGKP